jgi:hypothetical protein
MREVLFDDGSTLPAGSHRHLRRALQWLWPVRSVLPERGHPSGARIGLTKAIP